MSTETGAQSPDEIPKFALARPTVCGFAAFAYPDGSMTASGLRREAARSVCPEAVGHIHDDVTGVQSLDRLAALMGRQFERSPEPDAPHFGPLPADDPRQAARRTRLCEPAHRRRAQSGACLVSLDLQIALYFG
jgi:hypothetical protein